MNVQCAASILAGILVIGCHRADTNSEANRAKTQASMPDSSLLGRWVTATPYNGDVIEMDFKENGKVEHYSNGKRYLTCPFSIESVQAWDARFQAKIKELKGPDAQKAREYSLAKLYGENMQVVNVHRPGAKEPIPYLLDAQKQLLTWPFVLALVRPGSENKKSKRLDAGDGSRAPFRFLDAQSPIFADESTGDWAYTFKGDWAKVLKTAAAELRRDGFDGVPVENEPAGLKGETGTVIYYRTHDSESVGLSPNLHSAWKSGKWATKEVKGWVTVHVDIEGP